MSPWTVKSARRRRFARIATVLAAAVPLVGVVSAAEANPDPDPNVTALSNGIESFATRLAKANDSLGDYGALANSLPLVDLSPGSPQALDLSNALKDAINPALNDLGYDNLDGLKSALDGVNTTVGGVQVDVGTPTGTLDALAVPIALTRSVNQPLDFEAGIATIDRGKLSINFTATTTLTFRVDPALVASQPAEAVSLVVPSATPPKLSACAAVNTAVAAFATRLGFTDITVATDGAATMNACADVTLKDPDSSGFLTKDEFTSAALTEIADANVVDGPGTDLDATFTIDASLIPGSPDGSIDFTDPNLADAGLAPPTTSFGFLDDWDNVNAGDVATGFAQFVASFSGAQTQGNGPLPFIEQSLSGAFDAAAPLVQFARRITDADVVCGTREGLNADDIPTGSTANIDHGKKVYCRAKAPFEDVSDTVVWTPANATKGANTGEAGIDGGADPEDATVGPSPTDNAEFTMNCGSAATCSFDVTLTFDADPDGPGGQPVTTFTAIPKPQTALELCNKVAAAASLGASYCNDKLTYATSTRALTLRVTGTADPPAKGIRVDFGDKLRNATNLAGLEREVTNPNADLDFDGSVDASGLGFDLSFGVILVPNLADITPAAHGDDPGTDVPSTKDDNVEALDRFFVQVDNSTDEHELSLNSLSLGANVDLTGKVGFLEVSAAGSDAANPNGTAFDVGPTDGPDGDSADDPVLELDVKTPDAPLEISGTPGIANAIGLEDLLFNLDDERLAAVCSLAMSAGLAVEASVGGNSAFARGSASVNWPSVFKPNSCEPDLSTIDVDGDVDFDANLKHFDPQPSLTGTHNGTDGSANLVDSTKDFDSTYGTTDGSALSMTLRNKTTGASCMIATLGDTNLNCTLTGGSRPADDANKNKWKVGDDYEVDGNALAMLELIISRLDELLTQLEAVDPGLTNRKIPVLNISTKELVAKIQGLKATLNDLRGFPLGEIRCTRDVEGDGPPADNAIEVLPDGTPLYCRATSTITPTNVTWTGKELVPSTESPLTVVGAFRPDGSDGDTDPDVADMKDTAGPSPTAAVKIIVTDADGSDGTTTISEWRVTAELEDAGGLHTVDFPTVAPPQSLQDLESLIEDKLGIDDENVFKLDLLDLPAAGEDAVATGTASGGDANTLEDSGADLSDVQQGMQLVNLDDKVSCTIADVDDSGDTLECQNPLPGGQTFANGDDYEVVGDGTKDLVIRLGAGYCAGGTAAGSINCATDAPSARVLEPISTPLNLDLESGLSDLVGLDTSGELQLQYIAKAQLDIGVPLKVDLTPDVVVLDTTGASVEGRVIGEGLGLQANLGPLGIALGTDVTATDTDPTVPDDQPAVGVLKLGAKLGITKNGGDEIDDNRTFDFGTYFGDLAADFEGVEQSCADSPDFDADACLILSTAAEPQSAATTFGPLKVRCDAEGFQTDPTTACDVTPPPGLQAFFNSQGINLTLLFQVLPKLLEDLEAQLDGAARGVSVPIVGDALDAGANIVGTFNANVVTPFSAFATQLMTAADADGDGVEPGELAKKVHDFIHNGLGGAVSGFNGLGSGGADLLLDLDGDGVDGDAGDVVVTPLCNGNPCPDGAGVGVLTDMRVTFKLGKDDYEADLPFDIGLDGFPLRLGGTVVAGGGWSVLVDFGLSKADGPYLVTKGKKSVAPDPANLKVNRPFDNDPDGTPGNGDETWADVPYLQDDDTSLVALAEIGMTLHKVGTDERCTITKIETLPASVERVWCDDPSTASVEGILWHQEVDDAQTSRYEIIALHPPDANDAGGGGAPEVNFHADVTLGDHPTAGTCTNAKHDYDETSRPYLQGFSTSRCLEGELGFIAVTVRDVKSAAEGGSADGVYGEVGGASAEEDEDPTKLGLDASIDIRTSSDDRITFADLTAGAFSIHPSFDVTANVDVRIRTGLNVSQSAGFPSVVGKLHLFWHLHVGLGDPTELKPLDIEFDGLNLDAGRFVSEFLGPIAQSVQNITKPLQPVVQFLQAPLPVISDISEAVGQGAVTPLDLLEALADNDLSLVRSVIQFVNFVNALPKNGPLLIELGNSAGKFHVSSTRATNAPPTPDSPNTGIENASAKTNIQNDFASSGAYAKFGQAPADNRPGTFGVAGLTFPIFSDAKNIFAVLMGQDQTLVRYEAGTLRARAGFGYSFPPIMAGPIPVVISLGGEFEVRGRFAIGYDTSGLRKVMEGGSGTHLLDGIFIDDHDAAGNDVPEIQFIGTVYAEGAASIAIISVGVRGALIFTTSLDLDDRPTPDGKLRIEEIVSKLNNPICLFIVSGQLDVSLAAFVEIDLFFFTKRFTIEIVRITLLKFEAKCEPEVPNLAEVVGGNLVLNSGPRAGERNVQEGEKNEKFVVRQMESYPVNADDPEDDTNDGKTRFTISAFGIVEDEFLVTSAVNAGTAAVISAGVTSGPADDGNDTYSFLGGGQGGQGGSSPAAQAVPFTLRVVSWAGSGDDTVNGGDRNDEIRGGPGNDTISSGKGVDDVRAGTGDDTVDVGEGNDIEVFGEAGHDTISGGPGADEIDGGTGDDNLGGAGGPASADAGDKLIGGDGNDTLAGATGNDILIGDADDSCTDNTLDDGTGRRDALDGGPGDDKLYGGPQDDQLTGFEGKDELCGNRQNDQIDGGPNEDHAEGGAHRDNIVGGSDDSPTAGGGDDLYGDFETAPSSNATSGRDFILGDEGTLTVPNGNTAVDPIVSAPVGFVGNDLIIGGGSNDVLHGQAGVDDMRGGTGDDFMKGYVGNDLMRGDGNDDDMFGDDGTDTMYGSDNVPHALDQDNPATVVGDDGVDIMRGGLGEDLMYGDEDDDEVYGDNNRDRMYGGTGDDLMRGGSDDDDIEGNANDTAAVPADADPLDHSDDGDLLYGDGGQDDITGGSSVDDADADGGDTILGNREQDVIVGDNGDITRPGTETFEPDGTKTRAIDLETPTGGGGDHVEGNEENDDVYGGGGDDEINGNAGDDYVEGNGGGDDLFGDDEQDDLVGGTSPAAEDGPAPGTGGGEADGDDDVQGNAGHDVIAGDNASIFRAAGTDCPAEPGASAGYNCNTFSTAAQHVVIRRVAIYDVYVTGESPDLSLSGDDTIAGNDGHDIVYAGDGTDTVHGNNGDDQVFGNNGGDILFGDADQDDLIGGTGRTDSGSAASAVDGRLDGADTIHGNDSFDAIAGDNSRMVRSTDDGDASDNTGAWEANTFNAAVDRTIALMDVGVVATPAGAGTSGNDKLLGDDQDDVVYGQGGNDGISGGAHQDILEGNANGSGDAPNPDAGVYATWPTHEGDVIHGDSGADDIAGGTGWIFRMVGGVETCDTMSPAAGSQPCDPLAGIKVGTDGRLDGGDRLFGDGAGDSLAGDNTVIERALTAAGAWILDDLHSPDALGVVRRITRERDVATAGSPAGAGTSGADFVYGNAGVDVAYGQGADDTMQGNEADDHLEGNAGDDTITGNEGRDDVIGGTGRTFSNDESTATAGRIDEGDAGDPNDTLHGGGGLGGVATDDDDVVTGDNATVDRLLGALPAAPNAELGRLPFNGAWGEATWDEPNILRVIRLLDVATTAGHTAETNGTNGADTINGEADEDVLFGQGAADTISGDDADLNGADPGDTAADDYIEGNGGADAVHGNLGEDDITGGGSAANGVLDANRDGTLDPGRSGETLRDADDEIVGDSGDEAVGAGDVVAGDNARIQRPLAGGDWMTDAQRSSQLRDVILFDISKVGAGEPGDTDPGESGADSITGNGGPDILVGQGNGTPDTAAGDAYGAEDGAGAANCQDATGGPGTGSIGGGEEAPNGDNDNDDLPDLNDPQCRLYTPGDNILGQIGQDYIEGNQGSDTLYGGEAEDDVVGGSSSNTGHLNVILPPGDRDAGFTPGALAEASKPNNLNDGHDVIQGNAEDDLVAGDNGFVDRYLGAGGAWITIVGAGHVAEPATDVPAPEPARLPWDPTDMVRRDVTTKSVKEDVGAFGNDFVQGNVGKDDVYGLLGNDWLEGNDGEDAIVGDMGKVVGNNLGTDDAYEDVDPPLNEFIRPNQPFLGATINASGVLKREVTLYAFDQSLSTVGLGHDVALGGGGNDWVHTGPGDDLANGNAGDDRLFLGDNTEDKLTDVSGGLAQGHDQVDAAWGGGGHDHLFGGYGADYLDVRPRSTATVPGLVPTSDPETWFQIAGAEASHNAITYPGNENFEGFDYIYGGWDQDSLQANEGGNGPVPGDRLLDWSGSYNGYYLCPSTYGDWVSTRSIAPGLIEFLQALSQGNGATTTATAGTSGFHETAMVFSQEAKFNTKPIHPDTPAHFTCGPGTTTP